MRVPGASPTTSWCTLDGLYLQFAYSWIYISILKGTCANNFWNNLKIPLNMHFPGLFHCNNLNCTVQYKIYCTQKNHTLYITCTVLGILYIYFVQYTLLKRNIIFSRRHSSATHQCQLCKFAALFWEWAWF